MLSSSALHSQKSQSPGKQVTRHFQLPTNLLVVTSYFRHLYRQMNGESGFAAERQSDRMSEIKNAG